jgi:excisionase family DNA binding protein
VKPATTTTSHQGQCMPRTTTPGKPLRPLTVDQVAERLGVDKQTVLNHIDLGTIQAVNIGTSQRKYWRVPVESLDHFLADRTSFNVPGLSSATKSGLKKNDPP